MASQPQKRRGRPRKRGRGRQRADQHTSLPTSRNAYAETREWLLETHGPVCAYCGGTFPPASITLDHVTPRKGQSAYDRRDNLVLACKRCNAQKADKPFLVYLLDQRSRAERLYRYGWHLSDGIVKMLKELVGDLALEPLPPPRPVRHRKPRIKYGSHPDEESPYRDAESPYKG